MVKNFGQRDSAKTETESKESWNQYRNILKADFSPFATIKNANSNCEFRKRSAKLHLQTKKLLIKC